MFLLVPAHPGSPGQRAIKRLCVCICASVLTLLLWHQNEHPAVKTERLSVGVVICLE